MRESQECIYPFMVQMTGNKLLHVTMCLTHCAHTHTKHLPEYMHCHTSASLLGFQRNPERSSSSSAIESAHSFHRVETLRDRCGSVIKTALEHPGEKLYCATASQFCPWNFKNTFLGRPDDAQPAIERFSGTRWQCGWWEGQ